MSTKTPFDVIRSAKDSERLGSRLGEAVEECDAQAVRDAAESLIRFADALGDLTDALEQVDCAEGREDKAEAREEALDALDLVVTELNSLPGDGDELLELVTA